MSVIIPSFRALPAAVFSAALAAAVIVAGGCFGDPPAEDPVGLNLEDAAARIAEALERAAGCGDVNPALTVEQITEALDVQYAREQPSVTFDSFVLHQVEVAQANADLQCGVSADDDQPATPAEPEGDGGVTE